MPHDIFVFLDKVAEIINDYLKKYYIFLAGVIMIVDDPLLLKTIHNALAEDIGPGDVTTDSIVDEGDLMRGCIIAKQDGIVAGLDVAQTVYQIVDERVSFKRSVEEGTWVQQGQTLSIVSGPARSLLSAERIALNFLERMSGIATITHQFVEAVRLTRAVILDTRKTAPGLRFADKLAVRLGGGQNHRMGLYDMALIKDNHIDFAGSITEAVKRVRDNAPAVEIEVEARTLDDVREALTVGVGRILLDNMSCAMMAEAVHLVAGRARLEASGNVSLENVRQIAQTGVDDISIGALTHSVKAFDISFVYIDRG